MQFTTRAKLKAEHSLHSQSIWLLIVRACGRRGRVPGAARISGRAAAGYCRGETGGGSPSCGVGCLTRLQSTSSSGRLAWRFWTLDTAASRCCTSSICSSALTPRLLPTPTANDGCDGRSLGEPCGPAASASSPLLAGPDGSTTPPARVAAAYASCIHERVGTVGGSAASGWEGVWTRTLCISLRARCRPMCRSDLNFRSQSRQHQAPSRTATSGPPWIVVCMAPLQEDALTSSMSRAIVPSVVFSGRTRRGGGRARGICRRPCFLALSAILHSTLVFGDVVF
eukprot:scaffold20712_cov100-Isochrysis_galbana.AAC.4